MVATAATDATLLNDGRQFSRYIHFNGLNRTNSHAGIALDTGFVRNIKQLSG
jgi:hypothetical protein